MRKLKKTLVIVITMAMLLQLAAITTVFAAEGDIGCDGDFDWVELETGSVSITAYTGYGGSVTIPAMLSGKTVTDIDAAAFKYDVENGVKYAARITEVTIQAPITSIAAELFSGCPRLASVTFGSDITEIGDKAFSGTALTSIKIPASVTTIGVEAFNLCSELADVTFDTGTADNPGALTTIGDKAFSGTKLTSVRIPSTVESIGIDAFRNCADLASVTFVSKASITDIGDGAFYGTDLVSVSIPNTIVSIGADAFANCEGLVKLVIDSATVTLGANAFEWSDYLTVYGPLGSTVDEFCTTNSIHFTALEKMVGNTAITSALSSGTNKITLKWSAAERATGYQVERKDSENGTFSPIATTTDTSFTNTGLTVNTTYYYRVRGFLMTDETHYSYGSWSDTVSAAPMPSAPNSAYAVPVTYNSIRVYWTPVPGASGYQIYRAFDKIDNTYTRVKTLSRSSSIAAVTPNSYKFTYLTPGRKYFYKVRAYVIPDSTTTKCFGAFSGITMAQPSPAKVTSFTASVGSPVSAKLSWHSVSGASRYQVYRKGPDDAGFVWLTTTSDTHITDNDKVAINTTYSYEVRAYRTTSYGRVYGVFSDIKSVTPRVLTMRAVSVSKITNTKVKVTWSGLTGVSGYELQWATSKDAPDEDWTPLYTGALRYKYHYITHGAPYYYRIRAYYKTTDLDEYPDGKIYGNWSAAKYYRT